jgi:predicted MFS family arabinose efflux permease
MQASVTGVAARRPDAQRVLALMQAAFVLLASVILFVSPYLVGRFGAAALFGILACVGVVTLVVSLTGFPADIVLDPVAPRATSGLKLPPILGCIALGMMILAVNTVWVYIITIGNSLGIDAHTLGIALAVVLPVAMFGPVAAHGLGERAGLIWPLLSGLVLMAVDCFLVVMAASPIVFCITTSALIMGGFFCAPYAIALISRLDPSGSFSSAAPAFMMIGNAIAPALGSRLAGAARFEALAVLGASCMALSIVLFSVAVGLDDTRIPVREGGKTG